MAIPRLPLLKKKTRRLQLRANEHIHIGGNICAHMWCTSFACDWVARNTQFCESLFFVCFCLQLTWIIVTLCPTVSHARQTQDSNDRLVRREQRWATLSSVHVSAVCRGIYVQKAPHVEEHLHIGNARWKRFHSLNVHMYFAFKYNVGDASLVGIHTWKNEQSTTTPYSSLLFPRAGPIVCLSVAV